MKWILPLLLSITSLLANAAGKVEFVAVGRPAFVKIHGTGNEPTAVVKLAGDKANGVFEFDLTSLDTGIELRNRHMKERYLAVAENPRARLQIADLPLKSTNTLAPVSAAEFTGDLNLHGVTRPVHGTYSIDKDGNIESSFKIKLSDFKIEIPVYLGVTVADEVDIQVKVEHVKGTM